jgi:hypothetical protein
VMLSADLGLRNLGWAVMSFASTGGSGDVTPDVSSPTARSIQAFFSYFDPDQVPELFFDMDISASAAIPLSGLSPGSHTFTAKYVSLTDSFARFKNRRITVIPMP